MVSRESPQNIMTMLANMRPPPAKCAQPGTGGLQLLKQESSGKKDNFQYCRRDQKADPFLFAGIFQTEYNLIILIWEE
jgi:hypothetical protein